jgi:hypothetical protein
LCGHVKKKKKKREVDDLQFFVVVARQIWLRRNSFVFGGDFISPSTVICQAKDQMKAFLLAEQMRLSGRLCPRQPQRDLFWVPPLYGVIKINWDAAICKREEKMGMGFIARDYSGRVLVSFCASKPYILDPGIAEVVSAWKMIEIVSSSGYNSVLSEGDSLEIVKPLKIEGCCLGRYGQVVNEAKLCLNLFNSWDICHVKGAQRRSKRKRNICLTHPTRRTTTQKAHPERKKEMAASKGFLLGNIFDEFQKNLTIKI